MAPQRGFGPNFAGRKSVRVKPMGNKKRESARDRELKFHAWN